MHFYHIVRFIANIVFRIIFRFDIKGIENIPQKGRVVLCSNHISILDPIMLAIAIPRPIIFMAKKELFENKFLAKLIHGLGSFPVDRQGADISSIKKSLRTLKGEKILGIFPEGTRVQKMDLDNVKPGVGLISIKSKSPIIPVYIESKYKLFNKVTIKVGKPMYFDSDYEKKLTIENYKDISISIMESIYSLKNL